MRNSLLVFVCLIFLNSCFEGDLPPQKDLITRIEALNSPDSTLTLYRYFVNGAMSFTSGSYRVKILPSNETFDSTNENYFYTPAIISNWIDKDTINCIDVEFVQDPHIFLPFKTEIKKWGHWVFKTDYYYANSAGRNPFPVDYYTFKKDSVIFKGTRDAMGKKEAFAVSFPLGQVSVAAKANTISAQRLEQYGTELKKDNSGKTQTLSFVSVTTYEFTPSKKLDVRQLIRKGVFVKREK